MSGDAPRSLVTHFQLGTRDLQVGQPARALAHFDAALAIDPMSAAALYNRGLALHRLGRLDEALASFERAVRAKPGFIDALDNAHALLVTLGRHEEAVGAIRERLRLHPPRASVLTNLALALQHLGELDEGRRMLEEAARLEPDDRLAAWNLALAELRDGELARGFARYRATWPGDSGRHRPRAFAIRELETLAEAQARKLLVHAEEGLGDTILYARFLPMLAARAGALVVEVQNEAVELLRRSFPAIELVARGEPLPPCDLHCPLHALPALFEVSLATLDGAPYLEDDPALRETWRRSLDAGAALRVGLAWSGDPNHPDDRRRSLTLAALEPLLTLRSCAFVSVQKDLRPLDAQALARFPQFRHFGPRLRDLSQTAALIRAVDVVVTSDTMVAHLAGALGAPTWVLVPQPAEWRWLRDRTDSPWYRSVRLFRQQRRGDWSSVVTEVAAQVQARRAP